MKNKIRLGAHMSIAGGLEKSAERGGSAGCEVVQIFSKNSNRWAAKKLTDEDKEKFILIQKNTGVQIVAVHDSYLINLGHPEHDPWEKSINAFIEEMERTRFLQIPYLVFHPGSHLKTGEAEGVLKVAEGLNRALDSVDTENLAILIETTAGQGANLGYRFEHIRDMIAGIKPEFQDCVNVCFDTCHVFASGYDLKNKYEESMQAFDDIIGLEKIKLFHINDSKKDLASRVDRHEHIGKGFLGIKPFESILNDKRINTVPMVLETPKGDDLEDDRVNLKLLRSLVKQ